MDRQFTARATIAPDGDRESDHFVKEVRRAGSVAASAPVGVGQMILSEFMLL
jgi:hypothetical protein